MGGQARQRRRVRHGVRGASDRRRGDDGGEEDHLEGARAHGGYGREEEAGEEEGGQEGQEGEGQEGQEEEEEEEGEEEEEEEKEEEEEEGRQVRPGQGPREGRAQEQEARGCLEGEGG